MDPATARAMLTELQIDAYTSVVQCFHATPHDLFKEVYLAQLRTQFGIDADTLVSITTEAKGAKSLKVPESRMPSVVARFQEVPTKASAKPKQKVAKQKQKSVMELNPEPVIHTALPTMLPQPTYSTDSKMTDKKKLAKEMNFRICKRWWPEGWFDGVITQYKPDTGACLIIYHFAQKKAETEEYNIHQSTKDQCILLDAYASKKDIEKWNKLNKGG